MVGESRRGWAPCLATAFANLEDHLVAVHRALEQQQQRCRPHVAAASAWSAAHGAIGPEAASSSPAAALAPSAEGATELSVAVIMVVTMFGSGIHDFSYWFSPARLGQGLY